MDTSGANAAVCSLSESLAPSTQNTKAVSPVEPAIVRKAHRLYLRGRIAAGRTWAGRRIGDLVPTSGVRILLYHRVTDEPDPLAIRPDRFRRQLESIRRLGLKLIPLAETYDHLSEDDEGRYVAITLDDGYLDSLTNAEPILRELEVPATVFLPTGIISGRERSTWYQTTPPRFLGWDDVPELMSSGVVEVQPHGVAHFALPKLDDEEARHEILGSITELCERAGVAAHTYSYAAGRYGPREQAIVAASSARGAVTCDAGVNRANTAWTALRRTPIYGWESDAEFASILGGAVDGPSAVRRVRRSAASARVRFASRLRTFSIA